MDHVISVSNRIILKSIKYFFNQYCVTLLISLTLWNKPVQGASCIIYSVIMTGVIISIINIITSSFTYYSNLPTILYFVFINEQHVIFWLFCFVPSSSAFFLYLQIQKSQKRLLVETAKKVYLWLVTTLEHRHCPKMSTHFNSFLQTSPF